MKEIIIATKNKEKFKEIKKLLRNLPVKIVSLNNFKNVPKIKENGRTFKANAKKKAIQTSRILKRLVLADDSGLEIESLGNRPGVYSARFSGRGATYDSNNKKVLNLLKSVPISKRTARFRCIVAIADKGKVIGLAEGRCKGKVGFRQVGKSGFGYDPLFIPDGYRKTFAQLGSVKKNKISHRSKALIQAKKIIEKYLN